MVDVDIGVQHGFIGEIMSNTLADDIHGLELAFQDIERETPCLKPVATVFREVLVSRAKLKKQLEGHSDIQISPPDSSRLSQGYPWLTEDEIAAFVHPKGDSLKAAIKTLLQVFPSIKLEVLLLSEALFNGVADIQSCVKYLVEGREDDLTTLAEKIKIHPIALKFMLGQIIKPFVEKRTEELGDLIKDIPWFQGYCPICGTYPELSYLKGKEGQRWLRCSLCGHDWRFDRMTCPYCGEADERREFLYVEGTEYQWVEFCSNCNRYIVGIDLRKRESMRTDVAAIGMVHLDAIAQQKGFHPIANCAWNMVFAIT